jgi:DNA-directed RNA polymerase subunit RPC12/RpoP
MEVRESFIFHAEYIADIPEELQPQYAMHAINYALKGIEPELADWRDVKMWNAIKNRIDGEAEAWEETKKQRSESGKLGGQRSGEARRSKTKQNEAPLQIDEANEAPLQDAKQSEANEAVSVFVNEFVPVTENDSEFVPEPDAPSRVTPSAAEYSNRIYKVFHEAGLPCARNNPISFLQRDFKNAMAFIHKSETLRKVPPDDIIAACENYAKTVNNPQSFITGKYSFERLVTFKNFVDYLPENYVPENFVDEKKASQEAGAKPKREWKDNCPACGTKMLSWNNQEQKYICEHCGRKFDYEEINR